VNLAEKMFGEKNLPFYTPHSLIYNYSYRY